MVYRRPTSLSKTGQVLERVLLERAAQEKRYGHTNELLVSGTGPETRWLGPYTNDSAEVVQKVLRHDYEDWNADALPTWLHLVREELAEAFEVPDDDPERLAEELIQVAALCVSWVERLTPEAHEPPC